MSATEVYYDHAAEVAVLAACLVSPVALEETKRHLVAKDFYDPRHEAIFHAIGKLARNGKQIDAVSLLAVTRNQRGVADILPDIVTALSIPEHVGQHAEIVRSWSTRRQIKAAAQRALQNALNPDANPVGHAASVANEFAAIRDSGVTDEVTTKTLGELLADPDDEPDWLIPGFLERRDRFMLTGEEGLGKSHLLRQFAICAAAGIDPWDAGRRIDPIRSLIVDCENTERQVKGKARGIAGFAAHYGRDDVTERVFFNCHKRMDITRDKDLAEIHRELDLWNPDLVVIGPLYRLVPRAIQNDDDAAPVLAALDTIRDRGIALLIEAHAGHAVGKGGTRDMRPRGSSALLGWPEFGYGMRGVGAKGNRYCEFIAWRGNRSEREWPEGLRRADDGVRWVIYDKPMPTDGVDW